MPLVSVIIPAFNSARYILQTLDSVLAQTEQDFEVIIVDDGSTDNTCSLIEHYDSRITMFRQHNQGIAGARNAGLSHASGKYIAFLDHDDIWHPDKLKAQLDCFRNHPDCGCVFSQFRRWDDRSPPVFEDEELSATKLDPNFSGWIYHRLILDNILLGTALFRRDVVRSVGQFSKDLPPSDDWDFVIRVSRNYPFCMLLQVSTLYRIHPGQTSRALPSVNQGAQFRDRIISLYGYTGPDGSQVNKAELRRYYFRSHMAFGTQHYRNGDPWLALRSSAAAIRCRPFAFKAYAYLVLSAGKMLRNHIFSSKKRPEQK